MASAGARPYNSIWGSSFGEAGAPKLSYVPACKLLDDANHYAIQPTLVLPV